MYVRQGCSNPDVAEFLHRRLLDAVHAGDLSHFRVPNQTYFMARFINCISWFGKDFAEFGGHVFGDEEHCLTDATLSRPNQPYCGRCLGQSFAFRPQREHLEQTDLLQCYRDVEGQRSLVKPYPPFTRRFI